MTVFLATSLAGSGALLALSVALLVCSGELEDIREIARTQQESGGIYGSATHENFFGYKMALHAARRPRIVALGSSRVLTLRQYTFTERFVNLGSAMRNLAEGERAVQEMLALHRPDVVLVAFDFWWFNPDRSEQTEFPAHHAYRASLLRSLGLPLAWLWSGRLPLGVGVSLLHQGAFEDVGEPAWGVQAAVVGEGFRPDGSRRLRGPGRISATLASIGDGANGFEPGVRIDQARLRRAAALLSTLTGKGIEAVTYLPPVAPSVLHAMAQTQRYAYVEELRSAMYGISANHYDFHDLGRSGAADAEFVDGIHAGETATLRLLLAIARAPESPLRGVVATDAAERGVRLYRGLAVPIEPAAVPRSVP